MNDSIISHLQESISRLVAREQAAVRQLELARAALSGIASCATSCGCCEMHKRIAERGEAGILSAAGVHGWDLRLPVSDEKRE